MSRVDDLIAEYAPNGVEFRTLGDIARFVRGNGMPKTDLVDEGVGAIHYGQIYTRYGVWATETISFVAPETAMKLAKAQPGDIIITNTSENVEDVGKAVAWLGAEPIVTGGHATVIQHDLDPKYLAYWFQSESFSVQKRGLATGTKVIDVSARQLAKVRLPVPPTEVQREIVRILDQFTRLEAELEAELEARRRQYEHYKSALLVARGNAESVAIASHIAYVRGLTYSKADEIDSPSGGIAVLRSNNIDLGSNRLNFDDVRVVGSAVRTRPDQWLKRNDILLSAGSGSRAHVGKAAFITDDMDYTFGGFMAVVRANGGILPRYLYHHLTSSRFRDYLDATIASTTINNLTRSIVGAFTVPLIDINEQERVAALLDAFDALTNDLNVGLPAEIAARRKQYAYYRDKLFSFEEAAA